MIKSKFKQTTMQNDMQKVESENKGNNDQSHQSQSNVIHTSSKLRKVMQQVAGKIKGSKQNQSEDLISSSKNENSESFTMSKLNIFTILNPKRSLGIRISNLFVISLVLCVAIVGSTSYTLSKQTLEENIIGASEETLTQVARNIDSSLKQYEDLTFQIMFDEVFLTSANNYISTSDMIDQLEAHRALNNVFSTYILSNNQIKNIALIPIYKEVSPIVRGTATVNISSLLTSLQYQEQQWIQDTVTKRGAVSWLAPQAEGYVETNQNNTVVLSRFVTNTDKGNEFVLAIEFEIASIFSAAQDVSIIDNSYLEIINSNNQYVNAVNVEHLSQDANFKLINYLTEETQGSFIDTHKETGAEYIIVYSQLEGNSDWYLIGALPEEEISSEIRPILRSTILMIGLAVVIALVMAVVLYKMISKPLTQLTSIMTRGSKGDLTVRSPKMKRVDEIGVLSSTFDKMMIQIENLARQTTHSAQEVLLTAADLTQASHKTATAGKEISIATDEIAAGASALAVEAEKGSDLTSSINEQMSQVNSTREQMIVSAGHVEQASEQGLSYMNGLIEQTGLTEKMVTQMVEKVNTLSASTKSIVNILDVLTNITKQTNILSLNATIEAARAGQAGKGFMVVADEVRQLAEQSKQSINVVADITATISNEIVETVTVLKQAQPIFQEQIVSVKEANQIFYSVKSQMDLLKGNINEVSVAFDQLNQSQESLSQSMNSVSAVAQQSSATSEEVASLSSEQLVISDQLVQLSSKLENVSNGLKTQLSRFNINE